ncbi:MAG TPA: transglutaminase domain-containing protein [Pseudonocardiaceae bacterium]
MSTGGGHVAGFYTQQSAFSDPGALADRYAGLPADPAGLVEIPRGLMIHRLEAPLFDFEIPEERLHHDAETRCLDDILRIITERCAGPLDRPRAPEDRFVGLCRDFALLHCSLLRHIGIPARLRCGFADYFGPARRST